MAFEVYNMEVWQMEDAITTVVDANGFAVTNVSLKATKELKITDTFSVPVFAGIAANPSTEKAFFIFGLSL